jgi:limonene-1,2-epoxide hydrolase
MAPLYGILQQLIQAWQAKDLERVLSFMDDDIVWHYAAAAMPPVRGKATAAKLLGRFQADMNDIQWRIFAHAETADTLFVEGVDEYRDAQGKRVAAPYAGVLQFRDGRIVGWRDYVDIGVIAQQKDGAPLSPQVLSLIERPPAPAMS